MDEITQFFTVITERGGRMYPCPHKHLDRDAADACANTNNGIAIMEWVKDRDPQFAQVWVHPDIEKEGKANG